MILHRLLKNNPRLNNSIVVSINFFINLCRLFVVRKHKDDEKIGIIALHRLGDAIFTIPAIQQLDNYHKDNLSLLCFSETIPIYKIAFQTIEFVEIRHDEFLFTDRIASPRLRKKFKKMRFTTIYDLTGVIRSASLLFNYPANKIIGLNEPHYCSIYTRYIPIRTEPHISDNYLDVVRAVTPLKKIESPNKTNNELAENILIHPFASLKSKEWNFNKYVALAETLNEKHKCFLIFPQDRASFDVLEELRKTKIEFVVTSSTSELIEVINHCILLIGNDSGPVHIANLLGKPTFTIYGPTNPDFHKPLNGQNQYIINQITCSPEKSEKMCFTLGGVYCPSYECMHGLDIKRVEDKINRFLKTIIDSRSSETSNGFINAE